MGASNVKNTNPHKCDWHEEQVSENVKQFRCSVCERLARDGSITPEEEFRLRVTDIVVADFKANGPIRMALLGL
jgi:hypothetical protein